MPFFFFVLDCARTDTYNCPLEGTLGVLKAIKSSRLPVQFYVISKKPATEKSQKQISQSMLRISFRNDRLNCPLEGTLGAFFYDFQRAVGHSLIQRSAPSTPSGIFGRKKPTSLNCAELINISRYNSFKNETDL